MSNNIINIILFLRIIQCITAFSEPLIIGGTYAEENLYPFMVSIRLNNVHICSGTILNPYHILTAAHRVAGLISSVQKLSIQYGNIIDSNEIRNVLEVQSVIIHEEFSPWNNYANDIAILRLKKPILLNDSVEAVKIQKLDGIRIIQKRVHPARRRESRRRMLRTKVQPVKTSAIVVGWGCQRPSSFITSHLLKVAISVYGDFDCKRENGNSVNVTSQMCAGAPDGEINMCTEASGVPLIQQNYQVGIMSWSLRSCYSKNFLGIWTKVINFTDWIKKTARI